MKLFNKKLNNDKRKVLLISLLLFAIVLAIGGSLAAYMNQAYMRGVVRNRGEEATRFTSNYLILRNIPNQGAEDSSYYNRRVLTFTKVDTIQDLSTELVIRNYIPGSSVDISDKTITYTLTVTISGGRANAEYTVGTNTVTTDGSGKATITLDNQTLNGKSQNSLEYNLGFSSEDLNSICFSITAMPANSDMTGGQYLAANVYPCTDAGTRPFECSGSFSDKTSTNSPSDFAAYNYLVTISKGTANVTIAWQEPMQLDPFFKDKVNGTINVNSITFRMNQENGTDSYLIPFFYSSSNEPESWSALENLISISAVEIEETPVEENTP